MSAFFPGIFILVLRDGWDFTAEAPAEGLVDVVRKQYGDRADRVILLPDHTASYDLD